MSFGQMWFGQSIKEDEYKPGDVVHLAFPNDVEMPAQDVTIVSYWRNGQWTIRESKHGTTVAVDAKYLSK